MWNGRFAEAYLRNLSLVFRANRKSNYILVKLENIVNNVNNSELEKMETENKFKNF